MALIKCKNCGKEISDKAIECVYCTTKIREDSNELIEAKKIVKNKTVETSSNVGYIIVFIIVGIGIVFGVHYAINHTLSSKEDDMPIGCYRATNRNGGLSDYELCIKTDSVVYNYLLLDNSYNSIEKTENLYPRWLSSSRTIQILDNYDDYWFDCTIDKENSDTMKCKGWGKGGFSLGSYSIWKKQ